MITARKGEVEMMGSIPEIAADISTIMRNFRQFLEDKFGKDFANEIFNQIIKNSQKSQKDIIMEIKDKQLVKELYEKVVKGMGE